MLPLIAALLLAAPAGDAPIAPIPADAVSVPLPAGVLDAVAPTRPLKGPRLADEAPERLRAPFVPAPETRDVLVGDAAWYSVKFSNDPFLASDHGEPMVRFPTDDPALSY